MKYIVLLMIVGVATLAYSLSLKPYTDEAQFREKYMQISESMPKAGTQNSVEADTESYSNQFFKLRDEMTTPKYRLQDIGITIIIITTIFLLLKLSNSGIKSPKSKKVFLLLAIALLFITSTANFFEIMQGYYREEYPWWADSMGIPIMSIAFNFVILFIWALLHLLFLKGINVYSISLNTSTLKKINPWLIFVSVISILSIVESVFYGRYYYVISCFLWLYFYLSLGAVRLAQKNSQGETSCPV